MTDTQLYLATGVPIVSNAIMLMIFANIMNTSISNRLSAFENAINKRFEDMKDVWRAELHRVEEVLDARLKHIEEGHRP